MEIAAEHDWIWDKPLYVTYDGGCCDTKRRIDLWTLVGNTMVAIEIDEHQHKFYKPDYEANRYNDLVMDFTGRFYFLRINPDSFLQAGERLNPSMDQRTPVVAAELDQIFQNIADDTCDDLVRIEHVFYDDV